MTTPQGTVVQRGGPALGVAAWAAAAGVADLISKAGAAWLHSHSVLRGRIVDSVNPAFSLGLARTSFRLMLLLAVLLLIGVGGYTARLAVQGRVPAWAPGLLIGGASANLVDRATYGAVHDWLRVASFAANLADFFVLAGIMGVGLGLVRKPPQECGAPILKEHHPPRLG